QVSAGAKKEKHLTLQVFFGARTHKVGIPFRTLLSKRGTWPRVMSEYLQNHFDKLRIGFPFEFIRIHKFVLKLFREQGLDLKFTF
ncbi:unnamed protein product, partial [Ixodes persulcatus]